MQTCISTRTTEPKLLASMLHLDKTGLCISSEHKPVVSMGESDTHSLVDFL